MELKVVKIFSILGIIAPLVFFVFITLASIFFPGYAWLTEYVSVLGSAASPFKIAVNVFGFGLLGIIMIALALALERQLTRNRYTRTGSRLFIGAGVLIILLAVFPTDGQHPVTFDGLLHTIFGRILFFMAPASTIWFGLAFRRDEGWDNLWLSISFALAGIGLISAVILGLWPNYIFGGAVERIGIGAVLLWMFLVSINMFLNEKLKRMT